ncbi:hypothetical protein AB0I98_35520 [Streptomyces sp. NPDC050211]|uniref:hypothetical protein n=1 Tax=Streptomyces sp. NPDC050211 TaxID=3154932 RepID=UPI00341DD545
MVSATEETTRVKVEMAVTEEVTYEFPITVDVPVDVVDDTEALTEYLDLHDELWVDDLPITGGSLPRCR